MARERYLPCSLFIKLFHAKHIAKIEILTILFFDPSSTRCIGILSPKQDWYDTELFEFAFGYLVPVDKSNIHPDVN